MTKRTVLVVSFLGLWAAMSASASSLNPVDFTGVFLKVEDSSGACPQRLEVTYSEKDRAITLSELMIFENLNGAWVIRDSGDSDFRIREKSRSTVVTRALVQEHELWQFPRPGRIGNTLYEERTWTLIDSKKAVFEVRGRKGQTEFGFFCEYEKH